MALAMQRDTCMDRTAKYYSKECCLEVGVQDRAILAEEYRALIGLYSFDLHPYRIIWQLLWETGMRREEVCTLRLENLDLVRPLITYRVLKPRTKLRNGVRCKVYKLRTVPITQDLNERLKGFLLTNKGSFRGGFLFPAYHPNSPHPFMNPGCVNHELDRVRVLLGGRWTLMIGREHLLSTHGFRRSWIVRYLDKYHNPMEAARAIGHENFTTTYKYFTEVRAEHIKAFVDENNILNYDVHIDENQSNLKDYIE